MKSSYTLMAALMVAIFTAFGITVGCGGATPNAASPSVGASASASPGAPPTASASGSWGFANPPASGSAAPAPTPAPTTSGSAAPPPPTPAPVTNPNIFPVQQWEKLTELRVFIGRYYYVTLQKDYVAGQVIPAVKKRVDEKTFNEFTSTFDGFVFVLNGMGDEVPAETQKAFLEWMKSKGCEKGSDGVWSKPCLGLYDETKKVAEAAIAAMPPGNQHVRIANTQLETANQYAYYTDDDGKVQSLPDSAGEAVILAHAPIALATSQLPEKDRPYVGLSNGGLVGQQGCILYRDGTTSFCGNVTSANDTNGITVGNGTESRTLTPAERNAGSAAFLIGDPSVFTSVIGKEVCFDVNGQQKCAQILGVDGQGRLMADGRALDFGQVQEKKPPTWSELHPLSVFARGVTRRWGHADGYDGNVGIHGVMLGGRYHLTDQLSLHGMAGFGSLTGRSIAGVEEKDSSNVFMAELGASVLLGSRNWALAPVIEANGTFQGGGPGFEGAAGLEFLPGSPADFRLMGSYGYFPTDQETSIHPYKPNVTQPFKYTGTSIIFEAGYTF